MTPKATLYKAPKGSEALDMPKEMDAPRTHIIYMICNLMKLYGVERVECNLTVLGPGGVTSPSFKMLDIYKDSLPPVLAVTQVTAMKAAIPLMMAYGILVLEVEYDEQDHIGMLSIWGATAGRNPQADRNHKPVITEPKNAPAKQP